MLVFGNTYAEEAYLNNLREVVYDKVRTSKKKNAKTIVNAICKKHGQFAQDRDLVQRMVEEVLAAIA